MTMPQILFILFTLITLPLSAQHLTKAQALQEAQTLATQWIADTQTRYHQAWQDHTLTINGKTMPFWHTTFGEKPADGYSLFISLHGGGNAPSQLNDSQWENQKVLYQPQNSVYLVPRAPYDDWDMWFKPDLDSFYTTLIQMCVAYLDVNPDKVYLIGYSAGGDGVWRMAPRMADTWAGASMMAGHPGDVSLLNLRNTPFMVWCQRLSPRNPHRCRQTPLDGSHRCSRPSVATAISAQSLPHPHRLAAGRSHPSPFLLAHRTHRPTPKGQDCTPHPPRQHRHHPAVRLHPTHPPLQRPHGEPRQTYHHPAQRKDPLQR